MTTTKFERKLLALLEINDREDLIPMFTELLSRLPKEIEPRAVEKEFAKLLKRKFSYSETQANCFVHEVMHVDKSAHKLRSETLKDKFKKVTQRRPVQGGSPGLGKRKS